MLETKKEIEDEWKAQDKIDQKYYDSLYNNGQWGQGAGW